MRRSRRATLFASAIAAIAVAYGVAVAALFAGAAHASHQGERAAGQAARASTAKGIVAGTPLPDLARAASAYHRAARLTGNPILEPIRLLPVAGRQLDAVHHLATAASDTALAAHRAGADAHRLLAQRPQSGPERVELLRRIAVVAGRAEHAIERADLGPSRGLLGVIARAHNRLAERMNRAGDALARGTAAAKVMADQLAGPRRELLVAANIAEMRAGSGMWLQGGELVMDAGRVEVGTMRSLPDDAVVPPGAVTPDGDLAARWGYLHPGQEWRNLMLSPRFDVNAELAARMWTAAGNPPVDGVISIDPVVLQAILRATGPITVDGKRVRGSTVLPKLLHDQYVQFGSSDRALANRRDQLGRLAKAAFDALNGGDWDVAKLARELGRAAAGRHIMAWSHDAATEAAYRRAGIAGDLPADPLVVSVENRGGNKLDQFLHVDVRAASHRAGGDDLVTVTTTLHNATPPGEPVYIAGPHPASGGQVGDYIGIVAINVPADARDLVIDGVTGYAALGPDGPSQVIAIGITVPMGARQTVVGHFRLPRPDGHGRTLTTGASARMPVITWRAGSAEWRDRGPHSLPLP